MYLYSNILGTFVFSQNFKIREKILFTDDESLKYFPLLEEGKQLPAEKKFLDKFKNITDLRQEKDGTALLRVLSEFRQYEKEFYQKNILLTRKQVSESVTPDKLIMQTSNAIDELTKTSNVLVKRLREWYSFFLPEFEELMKDNEKFTEILTKKTRTQLLKEYKIKNSMGSPLNNKDEAEIKKFASQILELFKEKKEKEKYLEKMMKEHCPNLSDVAGVTIGAKLIELAGSLRKMVMMPASTIQLLGAEKALFRHMRNKKIKPPKHGIIHEHPLLQKAKSSEKGKAARVIADKILLAVKVDYFEGDFIGKRLRKEIEEKLR